MVCVGEGGAGFRELFEPEDGDVCGCGWPGCVWDERASDSVCSLQSRFAYANVHFFEKLEGKKFRKNESEMLCIMH